MRRGRVVAHLLAAAVLPLAGCAVGPDFQRPAMPAPAGYTSAPLDAAAAVSGATSVPSQRLVAGQDIPGDWWLLFHSPALNALIDTALADSPDIDAARAALRAARENVIAQRGAALPSVEAEFSPTRQSVANAVASPLASGSDLFTLHTAQLSISYVPDVFGGNRRQVESLQAQADMQRLELEAARISLSSNIVAAVIQRASLQAQIRATRDIVAASERLLALYKRGRALGQFGGVDLALQEGLLAQSLATLPPLEKLLAAQGNQLALLAGKFPGDFTPPEIALADLHLPDDLPLSLPSRLVEHRPDILAAEEALHAASAQIGVATANRLPNLTLTASGGGADPRFSQLLSSNASFWTIGGSLVQPVFAGGTLLHRQRAAEALYEQAAAQYRGTVLAAFQNVADALGAIQIDTHALQALAAAEQAAQKSLVYARREQSAGLTGALPTVAAEQAYHQAEVGRIQAEADRLADSAALFQALGGGWWNRAVN